MSFTAATFLAITLLAQKQPPKPKALTDEAVPIDRSGLADTIAVSKDGKYLALMDSISSNVLLYDPKTFKQLRTLEGMPATDLNQRVAGGGGPFLVFSPDSKLLVASRRAPQYQVYPVWEVATGKLLAKLPAFPRQGDSIGFSPTGKEILASGYDGEGPGRLVVKFWSTELDKGQMNAEPKRSFKLTTNLVDIVLDPAGTRIYLYASEKRYVVADALTGEELETVETKQGDQYNCSGYSFELSPNAKLLSIATAKSGTNVQGQVDPGLLRVWDVEKKAIVIDALQPSTARYTAFSPDGKFVAVSCSEVMNVYEVATGKAVRSIEWAGIRSFAFDPDSAWIYHPGTPGMRVWRVKK